MKIASMYIIPLESGQSAIMLTYCILVMPNGRTTKSAAMSRRRIGETGIFYPEWFWEQGFRFADLFILVKKGKTEQVAKAIFDTYKNVLVTSWRINSMANLVATIYYEDSLELRDLIEEVSHIDFVDRVEFSETVSIVGRRSYDEVENDIKQRHR